jgi:hypothetical protein
MFNIDAFFYNVSMSFFYGRGVMQLCLVCNGAINAHGHRLIPINDQRHIKVHDRKLWKCDEVCAHVARRDKYHCPYKICLGACPLKQSTIVK